MDINKLLTSVQSYISAHITDADAPTYPNNINSVVIYDEPAGIGTYVLRITASFAPGNQKWSERAEVVIYCEGMEIAINNSRMQEISYWLHITICNWIRQQVEFNLPAEGEPRIAIQQSEGGIVYVMTFTVWRHRIPEAQY